jgi:hypothetical protein
VRVAVIMQERLAASSPAEVHLFNLPLAPYPIPPLRELEARGINVGLAYPRRWWLRLAKAMLASCRTLSEVIDCETLIGNDTALADGVTAVHAPEGAQTCGIFACAI